MAIDIRGLGSQDALAQIAKLAYGSGRTEKTSGGKGNIGILDGRVVKFNTHWRERGGTPSAEMRASCHALRAQLSGIATALLAAQPGADAAAQAKLDKALASVRRELGLDAAGQPVATPALLDRKVVAKVVNTIGEATGFDAWQELRAGDARALSSRKIDTTFAAVDYSLHVSDAVAAAVPDLAHPADGKPGVTLNARQTAFLQDLIRRDLDARRADGRPLPSAGDLAASVRAFTSKHLIVTLQAFGLDSHHLVTQRQNINRWIQSAVFLSGAPAQELTDRADVAVGLLENADPGASWYMGVALSLVSEKMPAMRARQPEGRLTGATVWKCCFGEHAPKGAAGVLGTRAFTDAFVARLKQQVVTIRDRQGAPEMRRQTLDSLLATGLAADVLNGAAFTPAVRRVLKDPKFVSDVRRDYVADMPLYNVEDACLKTEQDLVNQLTLDFRRQFPVIRARNGDAAHEADFRPLEGHLDRAEQMTRDFIGQMDALFGQQITPTQRKVMFMGLTQAGFGPFMTLVGVGGEHMQAQVGIRREDDGALVMTYSSMPDAHIEAQYSFRVEPDGTNRRVGDFVCRVREAE